MNPILAWRVFNFLLASTGMILMLFYVHRYRAKFSNRRLYLSFSHAGLLLTAAWASVENVFQHNLVGIRTVLSTASCIWTVVALAFIKEGKDDIGPRGGPERKEDRSGRT